MVGELRITAGRRIHRTVQKGEDTAGRRIEQTVQQYKGRAGSRIQWTIPQEQGHNKEQDTASSIAGRRAQ